MASLKARMYKIAVANGKMSIEDVPEAYREEVQALLDADKEV